MRREKREGGEDGVRPLTMELRGSRGRASWSGGRQLAGVSGRGLDGGAHHHPPQSLPAPLVDCSTGPIPQCPQGLPVPGHHQPRALQGTGAWRVGGGGHQAATALLWGAVQPTCKT